MSTFVDLIRKQVLEHVVSDRKGIGKVVAQLSQIQIPEPVTSGLPQTMHWMFEMPVEGFRVLTGQTDLRVSHRRGVLIRSPSVEFPT